MAELAFFGQYMDQCDVSLGRKIGQTHPSQTTAANRSGSIRPGFCGSADLFLDPGEGESTWPRAAMLWGDLIPVLQRSLRN